MFAKKAKYFLNNTQILEFILFQENVCELTLMIGSDGVSEHCAKTYPICPKGPDIIRPTPSFIPTVGIRY